MDANELFDICAQLANSQPSAQATRRLHEVLVLTAAEGCRRQGGTFGNLFSQVSFLAKKLALDTTLTRDIQTARRHSNLNTDIDAAEWPYDVMAVARLVAAVFATQVPGSLLSVLPVDHRQYPKGLRINKEYVRCIVKRVGERLVMADTADGELAIDYANTDQGRDFAYLAKLLRPGMQLNLLDCHIETSDTMTILTPGQVVVEPDFLIDISSLAACFTPYGHHPLLYTVNRLKPRPNTQATLLGNFAGTALDDIISQGSKATMAASLRRSFREQALRFCACKDLDVQKFRIMAEEQVRNIRQAVDVMGNLEGRALLEPSFVCERLGLQGRVDLMTTDMKLLVEQKSGKNMKIERQSHDSHGLQMESHYVQLLLYYGVLRYNFGLNDKWVDTRLLYSRYPADKGLLMVNYYRALLREAIQLRNQIVATELFMAREGAARILTLLRRDIIYKDVKVDAFFHRFVLPDIDRIQNQISALNTVERAYFERMLTFVYREQVCQKLGGSSARLHHTAGCTADLWQMPLQEKLETGNILMGWNVEKAGEKEIVLVRHSSELTTYTTAPNFRQGDMVWLYAYNTQPDVCNSILYKGTLQELGTSRAVVALNDGQQRHTAFKPADGRLWAIEHGGSDMLVSAAIRSLQQLMNAQPQRKALLLGQRAPQADTQSKLTRSYHTDYDQVLLGIKQTCDYFLLVGPPGTGKTSMAIRYMVEEELAAPQKNNRHTQPAVLLTAYTNRAVDEICDMLCNASVTFLRLGKAASCDRRFWPFLLDTALAETHRLDNATALIANTQVIVATTSMLQAQPWLLEIKRFTLAVVDEASQILEPGIVGLLSSTSVERFVLVGDHKQLPAVVQQEPEQTVVTEQCLRDIALEDCRQSLFERLLRWEQQQGRTQFVGTLHSHGRMHPDVALFPINHFYQREKLVPVPLPHQQELGLGYDATPTDQLDKLLMTRRVLFLDSNDGEEEEANMVATLLRRIHRFTLQTFNPVKTVGVIVPYRRQITLIRQLLEEPLSNVTIDTVERFQGSQRDVIIYSFAVNHYFQLDFLTASTFTDTDGQLVDRKMNVALTRARRQLIVTGRADILRKVTLFSSFISQYGLTPNLSFDSLKGDTLK